jgi:hypothetical protein
VLRNTDGGNVFVFIFYRRSMGKQKPKSAALAGCLRYLEKAGIYHWRNSTGAVRIALGRLAAAVRGWQELDAALRAAGYSGITDGPLFEAPEVRGIN